MHWGKGRVSRKACSARLLEMQPEAIFEALLPSSSSVSLLVNSGGEPSTAASKIKRLRSALPT